MGEIEAKGGRWMLVAFCWPGGFDTGWVIKKISQPRGGGRCRGLPSVSSFPDNLTALQNPEDVAPMDAVPLPAADLRAATGRLEAKYLALRAFVGLCGEQDPSHNGELLAGAVD